MTYTIGCYFYSLPNHSVTKRKQANLTTISWKSNSGWLKPIFFLLIEIGEASHENRLYFQPLSTTGQQWLWTTNSNLLLSGGWLISWTRVCQSRSPDLHSILLFLSWKAMFLEKLKVSNLVCYPFLPLCQVPLLDVTCNHRHVLQTMKQRSRTAWTHDTQLRKTLTMLIPDLLVHVSTYLAYKKTLETKSKDSTEGTWCN